MAFSDALQPATTEDVSGNTQLYLLLDPYIRPISTEHHVVSRVNQTNTHVLIPLMLKMEQKELPTKLRESSLKEDNILDYDMRQYIDFVNNKLSRNKEIDSIQLKCSNQKNEVLTLETHVPNTQCLEIKNTLQELKDRRHNKEVSQQGYVLISDRIVPPRAIAVLPTALQLRRGGISPRRILPAQVCFGPVKGIKQQISSSVKTRELVSQARMLKVPVFLIRENDCTTYIDVSDKDKSNWFSLLPLGDANTANVWLFQKDNELYGVTTRPIAPRTNLYLGYSKQYAIDHNIPADQPILDLSEVAPNAPRRWWCYECQRGLTSASLLQRHIDVCHKEGSTRKRLRRHRCRYCSQNFSRLFTLRRHLLHYCKAKEKKNDNTAQCVTSDVSLNTTLNIENDKIPSDESFQNYTNGLDFSTSLFDTDRMSLDISGNSRSESDLNPYTVLHKDENGLDLALSKLSKEMERFVTPEENSNKEVSSLTCPKCDQIIDSETKRQHSRVCPGQRFECECGLTFLSKDKLAQHIFSSHRTDGKSKSESDNDTTDASYECEKCQHTFKRRGMLVNHLWRVHKMLPAHVPLEKRIRHYPCVACPKVYRTAAKRNSHVRVHHPGAECMRAQSIEGGKRACEPAACTACPRQYATHAKLLQHVRAHHPHLALPLKKKKQ